VSTTFQALTSLDRWAIGVAAAAAVALALEAGWPHGLEGPAVTAEAPPAPAHEDTAAIAVGPLADYAGIGEQPLFAFDRRPYVPVVEQAAPPGPRVEFQLTAVIMAGDTQLALLKSNLTPGVRRVAINQALDGWTLAEIHPERVMLRRGTETVTVELRHNPDGGRVAQGIRVNALANGN
jgi:hypothetical protein